MRRLKVTIRSALSLETSFIKTYEGLGLLFIEKNVLWNAW